MELQSLLDQEGGLNKRQNTPIAFLKLFVKALGLESNRHLSILLEAVLQTNNKATLRQVFMPKLNVIGLHILVTMLWKLQSKQLTTAILHKGLRVLQHLVKLGVVEGRSLKYCTCLFCVHKMCKLLYVLTQHRDEQVRGLASKLQKLRFEMPKEPHSSHVSICEEAKKKAERKKAQEVQGLEEGKIPVDKK